MGIQEIIEALKAEHRKIDKAITALTNSQTRTFGGRKAARRKLSRAATKRMAAAQKARWKRTKAD
jgi:hypothetical protein